MGIWDTLIGLAATALKERPRHEVLEQLLKLRDAMVACQKTYDDYQAVLKEGDYNTVMEKRGNLPRPAGIDFAILYDPRELWVQAVENLAAALSNVDHILMIFSPETGEQIKYYGITEAISAEEHGSNCMDVLNFAGTEIDLKKVSLSAKFELALRKLDEFIRQNFKPEEVFTAQKGIKAWTSPLRFCGEYWLTIE